MPNEFTRPGIQFMYPDNWTLDEDSSRPECNSVTVTSPSGAFWSVTIHALTVDPDDLCATVLEAMGEIYDELESEEMTEKIADYQLKGYNMNFYCLDLTNTSKILTFRADKATYSIFCQADDRDCKKLKPVFNAISTSLLTNLAKIDNPD